MNKIRYIVTDEILEEQLLPNKASYTESLLIALQISFEYFKVVV